MCLGPTGRNSTCIFSLSSMHDPLTNMQSPVATYTPKRVVIIVKSVKSDEEIVKAFLRYSERSEEEYEGNQHYIHLDPDRKGQDSWSHIILDINAPKAPNCDLQSVPHEIYKVRSVRPDEDL